MKADCLPEHMHRSHLQRQECKCDSGGLITTRPVRVGERVIHEIYNWLHNIALTFSVFLFPGDQAVIANEIVWFAVAVFTHTVFLSLRVLQDVGVLPQPAERQLFGGEDGSRAETSESHQPSAK